MDRPNILIVDDDSHIIAVLGRILQDCGRLRVAASGAEALRLAHEMTPDLVLLDIEMPGMTGFEVCAALKESALSVDVPVIFLTSHDSAEQEVTGLSLGGVDFISKPPRAALLRARVSVHLRLRALSKAQQALAETDALTGLANRRRFDECLQREWAITHREGKPLAVLMVDIDCFKAFNDHYGHQAGDQALVAIARALEGTLRRPGDLLARYGGEEFVALLENTDLVGAKRVALNLLDSVDAQPIPHPSSPIAQHVTLSIGVAAYDATCSSWSVLDSAAARDIATTRPDVTQLVATADQALYGAKESGRHRAHVLSFELRAGPSRRGDSQPVRRRDG